MANRRGKGGSSDRFPLLGLQNHCGRGLQPWNQKTIASWQENNNKPRQCVEKETLLYREQSVMSVKAMVFPVVVYSCESWTIKKAEHQRIDAFKVWCWRRLLKVPWTARRSNQSILREINTEYSLEELMLKLRSSILVIWCKQMTHWRSFWWWERSREKGKRASEDKIVGDHHWCNEH